MFQQRFDQSLRLNLHYHALWADGSFACSLAKTRADFHDVSEVTDADVELLVRAIRNRVLRFLRRIGKLTDRRRKSLLVDRMRDRRALRAQKGGAAWPC